MTVYNVIGLMSGTSLDGVDLAFCQFHHDGAWRYNIVEARTFDYPQKWVDILANIQDVPSRLVDDIDTELGQYYGQLVQNFISEYQLVPDFVSSHGHTAYHEPEKGVTRQIGKGEVMAQLIKLPVINDFRKKDVEMGGQGAPLVPIGDRELFSEYSACLNLGGFANVSFDSNGHRLAHDICPVNMAFNEVAARMGVEFDDRGEIARSGEVLEKTLKRLNELPFYTQTGPKSLGREWYTKVFRRTMDRGKCSPRDLMRTLAEHFAIQISDVLEDTNGEKVLVTGGGAFNEYLIELIQERLRALLIIPGRELVEYKESLIFAFMGVLRMRNDMNVIASVTGAEKDHCSGIIHRP